MLHVVFKIWLWRFVLVTVAIVMTVGFYRMSYEALRGLFTGQILDYSTAFSYPDPLASVEEFGENEISIFVTLLAYSDQVENPAPPESLFIRVTGAGEPINSRDEDRVNGYPFLQAFVQKTPELTIQYLHQEGDRFVVWATKSVDKLNLKAAAPELLTAVEESLPPQPLTLFQWAAIGVLVVLGAAYVLVRIGMLRASSGPLSS